MFHYDISVQYVLSFGISLFQVRVIVDEISRRIRAPDEIPINDSPEESEEEEEEEDGESFIRQERSGRKGLEEQGFENTAFLVDFFDLPENTDMDKSYKKRTDKEHLSGKSLSMDEICSEGKKTLRKKVGKPVIGANKTKLIKARAKFSPSVQQPTRRLHRFSKRHEQKQSAPESLESETENEDYDHWAPIPEETEMAPETKRTDSRKERSNFGR